MIGASPSWCQLVAKRSAPLFRPPSKAPPLPSVSHGSRALGHASNPSSARRGAATGPISTEHPCPPLAFLSLPPVAPPTDETIDADYFPSHRHGPWDLFLPTPAFAAPSSAPEALTTPGYLNRVCDPLLLFV
ncbi:hypothetical protein BDA96_06G068800 [Sorghum bicolor]|uniref:Uncharacterized protein n=2 Tax=Sorghum bicolor TaxID=4558 RepID=A0A921UCJ9_SORBI|nr:hypothetical protein BDA96_06G068800 [Sorghum bicolor]KXG26181.1 hypothetical protein SORBI_3006G062000 [Sorghum bicolor]